MASESVPVLESPPLIEINRLTSVFLDPKRAFTDIALRPRWWVPVILLALASVTVLYTFSERVGWERYLHHVMDSQPRLRELSPEQRAQVFDQQLRLVPTLGYAGAVLGGAGMMLGLAGILLFLSNVVLGGQLRYKQSFAITAYAPLAGLVTSALTILMLFLLHPDDFNLQNPLAFNAAAYLNPQATPGWLYSIAGSFDLFSFWIIALLATGLSCASSKIAFGRALAAILVLWAVWVALKAAWVGLFG